VTAKGKDQRGPWGEATAEATVDEALRLMKPTRHCTPEVLALLAAELPGISGSVSEIAAMKPLRLASRLIGMQFVDEDDLFDIARDVDEDDLFDIARDLIAGFQAMLGPQPEPEAKPEPEQPKAAPAPEQRARQKSARTEEEYRRLLLGSAQGRKSTMSGDIRLGATVIESFETMSGDVTLDGTIVLSGGSTMSGDLRGSAYMPRGARISTISGDDRLDVRVESYEELARLAGLT
jgi:hypothetical protein